MRNIQVPSNLINELGVKQIIDITDDLPKLQPNGWDGLVPPRQLEALTDIVWHHSAMFLTDGCDAFSHARNHVRNGEGGCPYHFHLIDGQWYQTNDITTFTYGVASNNKNTIHVCVEGCYVPDKGKPADELSEENQRAMVALELTLRGILPNYKATNGHNYYKPTQCPGYSMTKFRERIREFEFLSAEKNDIKARRKKAQVIASRIIDLYNKSIDDKSEYKDVALEKVEKVGAFMIENDLMDP